MVVVMFWQQPIFVHTHTYTARYSKHPVVLCSHTYIHTYIHRHILSIHRKILRWCSLIHTHIHNRPLTRTQTYIHTHQIVRVYTMHTYMHKYIHTHIHTYKHTVFIYINTYLKRAQSVPAVAHRDDLWEAHDGRLHACKVVAQFAFGVKVH
jgi:hypothetical protein